MARVRAMAMAMAGAAAWLVAVTAATPGCGSSGGGGGDASASLTGTIGGKSVPSSDGVGIRSVVSHGSTSEAAAGVILTNVANACGVLQAHGNPPGATTLTIVVTASGNAVPAGTYAVSGSGGFGASASFTAEDANCNIDSIAQAYTGSVTLTTSTASEVAGSFDLTFEGQDHVTGVFSAPVCAYGAPGDAGPAACN